MTASRQARRVVAGSPVAELGRVVRDLALVAVLPASLLGWLALHPLGCGALLCLLPAAMLLYRNGMQTGGFHRTIVADAYAEEGSLVHGLLRGRLRLRLVSIAAAALLTGALFTLTTTSSPPFLALLFVNPLLVAALFHLTSGLAPRLRLKPRFARLFTKRQVVLLDAALLFGAGVGLRLFERVPAYLAEAGAPAEAIRAALQGVGSACPGIDAVVRLAAELDALQWWLLRGATQDGAAPALVGWAVWLSVVVGGGLIAAAYAKASVEAISLTSMGRRDRAHGS